MYCFSNAAIWAPVGSRTAEKLATYRKLAASSAFSEDRYYSLLKTIEEVEATANQKFLDTFNLVREHFHKVLDN
ncbi:MAG: hypothetical protein EOO88_61005, partial [Pedobacter sp.]